jgi:hypothetical protein
MMIGYCGLDCGQCEAFIATQRNDDALRAKVTEDWARSYGAPIKPEHINCTGCRSAGVKTYYCDQLREIRKCAVQKALGTCADCSDYPCAALETILRIAPLARATLDGLRKS